MKILIVFLLYLFTITCLSQQGYFFYNFKEKVFLKPVSGYIPVKFDENVDEAAQSMILQNVFGDNLESIDLFHVTNNKIRTGTFIIKLKPTYGQAKEEQAITTLLHSDKIKYVGQAFSINDKIVHLITDEVIVKFKKNVNSSVIQNLNHLFDTKLIYCVDATENIFLLSIKSKGGAGLDNVLDVANKYALTQFVDFAQPNFIRIGMLSFVPNDTLLPMQWNIKNTGHNIPEGIIGIANCDLNLEPAWDFITGNSRVMIGIIDTGVDTDHVDLKSHLCDRSLWYNAVDDNPWPQDGYNHGTAMCGIAAAIGNNIAGTCGVAWNCSIMPVKVFSDNAYTTDLILGKGLSWAWSHGADVLNNSWGGGVFSPIITHAIQNAKMFGRNGRGTVVFAATGNGDSSGIFYPAVIPEVIAVGGMSPCCQRKSRNPVSCDLEDWGANYGEGLSVVSPTPKIGCTTIDGGWHFYCNGTSSACPQITAIGAMILTKNINLSADSVRMIIERTSRKVGNYSYNIPKQNGLWNNQMGYGLPDALAALNATPAGPQIISDQTPPIINIIPPQSGNFNQPMTITASITAKNSVAYGYNSPRLYFNVNPSSMLNFINGVYTSNNVYTFSFPQSGPGLSYGMSMWYYIAAQDTSSNGNITTYPIGGRGVNPPGTSAPPRKLFLQQTNVYDTVFFSSDVPINITAQRETTIVSQTTIPIYKTILGVRCLLNITHDYDEDISVSLISPAGTEIVLTASRGRNGQNYTNTYFDDYSPNSILDTSFHAPFTGTFSPIEKLWLMNGENAQGTWKLKVVDNSPGGGGSLNAWSITLRFSTDRDNSQLPSKFQLVNNYPNPFNPTTRITFNIPYRARVKLIVYDLLGREVVKLLDAFRDPRFSDYVDFDINSVKTYGGSSIASGIYFYSLFADEKFVEAKKLAVVK